MQVTKNINLQIQFKVLQGLQIVLCFFIHIVQWHILTFRNYNELIIVAHQQKSAYYQPHFGLFKTGINRVSTAL